jgi:methyl-accepting chemotaxis protein
MSGRRRAGLAFGFSAIALAILCVGQVVLGIFFMFDQRALHRDLMVERARRTARFLAATYAHSLDAEKTDAIERMAESLRDDPGVIGVRVYDEHQNTVVRLFFSDHAQPSGRWNPFALPAEDSLSELVLHGGRQAGRIELLYSGAAANATLRDLMLKPPLAQALIFAFVIVALHAFFARRVSAPLDALRESIERSPEGTPVVIPDFGPNEIGRLGDAVRGVFERTGDAARRAGEAAALMRETVGGLRSTVEMLARSVKNEAREFEKVSASVGEANDARRGISEINRELADSFADNVSSLLEVKAMADEIVTGMDALHGAAENSYTTVAEMAQTSKSIAGSAHEILSSVENTSASIEEVIASVREVEKSAKQSSGLAENVRLKASQEGIATVAEAVEGMRQISAKVEYSLAVVRQLHSRSRDIELILAVIRDVTEKTNLLSLNAAILAEKAGTYGKGFAVVAQEMRALSDRTAVSTKEIDAIVKTVQGEINDVVGSIEDGMALVTEGGHRVYAVGVTMSDILEAAYNSALMTRTIEKATEEQVRALDHVEGSIVDISTMAGSMSKAMEEQIAGTGFMLDRVGEVREVAETTKKGTEEQAAGTRAIFRNFELASGQVDRVAEYIDSQKQLYDGVLAAIGGINDHGREAGRRVKEASAACEVLLGEIEGMRRALGARGEGG